MKISSNTHAPYYLFSIEDGTHAKRIVFILITIILLSSFSLSAQISREQAIEIVLINIVAEDTGTVNVYASYSTFVQSDSIFILPDEYLHCPYDNNWVFFIDDKPKSGWAHTCRYIFINEMNGEYNTVDRMFYPENLESLFELINEIATCPPVHPLTLNPNAIINHIEPNPHHYAVIICGGEKTTGYDKRYWYCTSNLYNTLMQVYGYQKENIFMHYSKGYSQISNDFDGNGLDDDIDFPAFHDSIEETFSELAEILGPDDILFVYVTYHGGFNGPNTVCAYVNKPTIGNDQLWDYELASYCESIQTSQIIFLIETCFSGGFKDNLLDYTYYNVQCKNRTIHTACSASEGSNQEEYMTGGLYMEFAWYWNAAVRGYYPVPEEPWQQSEKVGECPFNYINTWSNTTHPDDYSPDDILNSGNGDGLIQMDEAF